MRKNNSRVYELRVHRDFPGTSKPTETLRLLFKDFGVMHHTSSRIEKELGLKTEIMPGGLAVQAYSEDALATARACFGMFDTVVPFKDAGDMEEKEVL